MLGLDELNARQVFGALTLVCAALLGYAFYAQHVLGLVPCPLCMFQRVAVIAFGVVCLLGALHGPRGWGIRVYAALGIVVTGLGAAIAGRHVWLQSLPKDQLPSCAPPMDYMWNNLPFGNMLKTVMMTSGECANIDWTFLGFSMPAWTFAFFVLMAVAMIVLALFPPVRAIAAR